MALAGHQQTLGVVVGRVPADLLDMMLADDIHSCPDANLVEAKI